MDWYGFSQLSTWTCLTGHLYLLELVWSLSALNGLVERLFLHGLVWLFFIYIGLFGCSPLSTLAYLVVPLYLHRACLVVRFYQHWRVLFVSLYPH